MASVKDQIDAVRTAVASISTCTPTISTTLKDLLQTKEAEHDATSSKPNAKTRPAKNTAAPTKKATTTKRGRAQSVPSGSKDENGSGSGIAAKERASLATHVINATMKALGDAAKSPASQPAKSPSKPDPSKPRKGLRRSNSAPMTPLQPRSLNRVSTSPVKAVRSPALLTASTGCLAMVECARAAFATMRSLQASSSISVPELQLENGMSSFVHKLIALNLFELAAKELRILKRRLEVLGTKQSGKKNTNPASEPNTASKTFYDLLDFSHVQAKGRLLELIITAQIQALRILHGLKKSVYLDAALPLLRQSNAPSLMSLLLVSLQEENSDRGKGAVQLENVSKTLLSLSPSIAAKDDATALEPRLSPSPETVIEVQALGFTARLQSWGISGHKGDVDKSILFPLSKCLSAFVRRTSLKPADAFRTVHDAFTQIWTHVEKLGLKPSTSSSSPLATIYQVLGTTAREAGSNEARQWTLKLKGMLDPNHDSVARRFTVTAQLLALALKQSPRNDEGLIVEVLDALQGPLSGQSTELDDLLINLCLVRKAAIHIVIGSSKSKGSNSDLPPETLMNLEKLILQLPRFSLRWLGTPPQSASSTKDFLRFEQRRQLLSKYLHQILDSALMLINKLLDEERMAWDQTDLILMDTLALLENIGLSFQAVKSGPSSSYYVKISHFYYRQHLALRNSKATGSASLRALRRSIDAVKERPEGEQSRAQLLTKWKRLAETCKAFGRLEDAADVFRSIRDHLVRQEIIPAITEKLATEHVWTAWDRTPDAMTLSQAVYGLAKIDRNPNDWTWLLLDKSDKATALEHDLYFIMADNSDFRELAKLSNPTVKSLMQIYTIQQYPIRRLRVLLHLLGLHLDAGNETADLRTEAQAAIENLTTADLARDTGLAQFVPHLQSLATCMFALVDASIDNSSIKGALASWTAIVSTCHSAEELSNHIDDPAQVQNTLRSLADFARIEGLESLSADVLEVATKISKLTSIANPELVLVQSAALCARHLSLGQSAKVEKMLEQNKDIISRPDITMEAVTAYHLTAAEYHLAVGEFSKADHHLVEARNAATAPSEQRSKRPSCGTSIRNMSLAHASYLNSELALERGDTPNALHFARLAVRVLFQDWAQMEALRRPSNSKELSTGDVSQTETSGDDESSLNNNSQLVKAGEASPADIRPAFWGLALPLLRSMLHLSSIYAHLGLYQETLYYAEKAKEIANSIESATYMLQSDAWLALVWMMAGKPEKALAIAAKLKDSVASLEPTYFTITMLCELSRVYRDTQDADSESELMDKVDAMVKAMSSNSLTGPSEPEHQLERQMTKLSIKQTTTTKIPVARQTRTTKTTSTASAIPTKRGAAKKTKPATVQPQPQAPVEDVQVAFLRASVLQCQSMDLLSQKDWATAISNLHAAYELSKLSTDISQERMLMAMGLIGQSLELMGDDSVFSVVPDSTLSFPSIAASLKERGGGADKSPRKGRGAVQDLKSFTENLRQAQEYLLEAHSVASINGDGGLVHRIANLLQNVSILLSTTSSSRGTGAGHPAHATCSIELARNLIWRRERKTLRAESAKSSSKPEWPMPVHPDQDNSIDRRCSLGFSIDMNKFQRDYVDIIPRSWNVVSVSLSDTQQDLCITKLQAGHSPFAIRLPLERASSRDADSEVFSFRQGRAEMREVVTLSNRSCHVARDMSSKEAKAAWWAEREELDRRLGALVTNIEQTWLGGFRGIFTQHHRRSELLAKFQRTFLNMLDRHLPSRRQVRGRRAATPKVPKISLDPRIMDLFIGLGDPTAPRDLGGNEEEEEDDLEEPLTDLLYFVVDILQFHGERNAYDEIDFDSMVVETYDALHAYHHAVATEGWGAGGADDNDDDEGTHTILILDNALHIFPWESLPCMQGRSISRIPSLACLRRAILEQQVPPQQKQQRTPSISDSGSGSSSEQDELAITSPPARSRTSSRPTSKSSSSGETHRLREGHYASLESGTYILNPSVDLPNTAAMFGRPLARNFSSSSKQQRSGAWTAIENRAPTEDEFEAALRDSDILLYFGHGSGAQYVRARTLRRLDKCRAVALLMGCSSAELEDHFWDGGDQTGGGNAFLPHGPARNYMLAGAPAVVGTLWDVTDRDIDRFTARMFEEWGLMPRGTFYSSSSTTAKGKDSKGKGKEKERSGSTKGKKDGDDNDGKAKEKGKGKGKGKDKGEGDEAGGSRETQTSLVEAVAKARYACRFRYLTAAAVCVYGIPVYISK